MILTIPVKWLLSVVAAVIIHELGHAVAVILTGGKIYSLHIKMTGIVMDVSSMSLNKEVICALAGPVASLSLLSVHRWLPWVSLCGMIQGIYNLLPVYPLDGGRVLHTVVCLIAGEEAACRLDKWMYYVSFILIFAICIYVSVFYWKGIMPALVGMIFTWKPIQRKIPCKQKGI